MGPVSEKNTQGTTCTAVNLNTQIRICDLVESQIRTLKYLNLHVGMPTAVLVSGYLQSIQAPESKFITLKYRTLRGSYINM